LGLGCYATYLERIFEFFPREQVSIHLSEVLERDPRAICCQLFQVLGISQDLELDTAQRANLASEPRSRSIARLIKKVVHKENWMKSTLKGVLPSRFLANMARRIKEWNQRPIEKEEMKAVDRNTLEEFYAPWNERLESEFGLDLSLWQKGKGSESYHQL
jgi:hypothetical protein